MKKMNDLIKGSVKPFVFSLIMIAIVVSCSKDDDTPKNDQTGLLSEIQTVTNLISNSSEGNDVGDFPKGAISILQDALTVAEALVDNDQTTQSELDQGLIDLEDARFEFEAKEIEDVSLLFSSNGAENSVAVEQSSNSAEIFNRSAFTFETWVYYTDKPGFFGQMASTEFYDDGVWGWNVRIGDGDALDFTLNDDIGESRLQPNVEEVPAAIVPRNEWVHIACTFDGTTMKSYINGVEIGSLDASERTKMEQVKDREGAQPLTFGNSAGFKQPERRLVGRMFDVRYWNIARTAGQIAEDMQYIIEGNQDGLVGYWPFVKSEASDLIKDASPEIEGENNLKLVDGALVSTRN